jgi:hypothetical protein
MAQYRYAAGLHCTLLLSCMLLATPPAQTEGPPHSASAFALAHLSQSHTISAVPAPSSGSLGQRRTAAAGLGNFSSNATNFASNVSNVTYYETSVSMFSPPPAGSPSTTCPRSLSDSGLLCSGNGVCQGSVCTCNAGFSGADCSGADRPSSAAAPPAPQDPAQQPYVAVIIKVALPLGRQEFEQKRAAYVASVAATARVQTSAVNIVAVRDAGRRLPLMRRLLAANGVVVETQILVADVSAAELVTKEALDSQLAKNELPRSTGFEKTVQKLGVSDTATAQPWITQGWNILIVVVPAAILALVLALALVGCILYRRRRQTNSNKVSLLR